MIYYVGKMFWLIAAPTTALVLISAIAAFWAVLRSPNRVTWLAAAAACGLFVGMFTPIGAALTLPLEYRFAFERSDSQASLDGIVLLGGVGLEGIAVVAVLSHDYPKARLIFSGMRRGSFDMFAQLGGDSARINRHRAPTTDDFRGRILRRRVAETKAQ